MYEADLSTLAPLCRFRTRALNRFTRNPETLNLTITVYKGSLLYTATAIKLETHILMSQKQTLAEYLLKPSLPFSKFNFVELAVRVTVRVIGLGAQG